MVLKQACLFLEILLTEGCLLLDMSSTVVCTVDPHLYDSCSCCVDEVAAEHVQADCIIHFGPACLTQYVNRATSITVYNVNAVCNLSTPMVKIFPKLLKCPQQCNCLLLLKLSMSSSLSFWYFRTRRLPVLYVFGRERVDVLHCVAAFRELYTDRETDILVLYNTAYFHSIGRIFTTVHERLACKHDPMVC